MKLPSTSADAAQIDTGAREHADALSSPMALQFVASRSTIAVLVACNDRIIGAGLVATLESVPSLSVQLAESAALVRPEAEIAMAVEGFDVVVADYESALNLARALKPPAGPRAACPARIMIVSHRDSEADVRRALECGVQGYLLLECNPVDVSDGVIALHRGQRVLGRVVAQRIAESFDHEALTGREIDVLRLVAAGDANKLVAKKLSIALGTVKVHVRSIMSKLSARTRTEAAAVARRRGLVDPDAEVVALPGSSSRWPQVPARDGSSPDRTYPGLRVAQPR